MYILGLSCFYHDSAACLLHDGVPIGAASEQAFTRTKHDPDFPVHAIRWLLSEAGIEASGIDAVAFYDKPMWKFERMLLSHISTFPLSFPQFVKGMPSWFATKLRLDRLLKKELGYAGPILYGQHHLSHAASSFYASGFDEAAVLTVDGVGEWATASWGVGRDRKLELKGEIRFPHSLGLLYSAFTFYLGFKVNSAEYKVMGLAPYGEPLYVDRIKQLIHIAEDGTFRLDMRCFTFDHGMRMFNCRFEEVMGRPARPLGDGPLEQFHKDVARSLQEVVNEVMVTLSRRVLEESGMDRLCLAGGVALNCVANGHILREAGVRDLFVQPAAGDAGGALGAALWAWHDLLDKPREWALDTAYLGPGFGDAEVAQCLETYGAPTAPSSGPSSWRRPPASSMRATWSAGTRGGWSGGPAPSATAPSLGTRATPRCATSSTARSSSGRASARSPRRSSRRTPPTGSSWTAPAPTCCWSPRFGRRSGPGPGPCRPSRTSTGRRGSRPSTATRTPCTTTSSARSRPGRGARWSSTRA